MYYYKATRKLTIILQPIHEHTEMLDITGPVQISLYRFGISMNPFQLSGIIVPILDIIIHYTYHLSSHWLRTYSEVWKSAQPTD